MSEKFTVQWYETGGGGKKTKTFEDFDEAQAVLSKVEGDKRANKFASTINVTLKQSKMTVQAEDKVVEQYPFDEVAERFHKLHAPSIKAPERERYALDKLIVFFGSRPIGTIRHGDLMAYLAHRVSQTIRKSVYVEIEGDSEDDDVTYERKIVDSTISPSTAARELRVMRQVILHARDNGYVQYDAKAPYPFKNFKWPKDREVVHKVTQAEKKKLYSLLPPNSQPLFEFLAESGCRISEGMKLKRTCVDEHKKQALLVNVKTGGEKEVETLYLSDEALAIIKAQPRISEYVFTNPQTLTRWKSLSSTFTRAAVKTGLVFWDGPLSPHDLRHNQLTDIAETEVSESTLMLISRHKDPKSLKRYLHRDKEKAAQGAFSRLRENR